MRFLPKVIVFVTLLVFLITTESAPESALITKLPGFSGTFPSKHYSGYVTIDKEHGKNLWYYFVESEMNPSKDPVVLWLNGGPGCSSMDGFVYEHGPFNFEPAKTNYSLPLLHLNPYSWSKVSNMIYLDSPVGVGFSYSKNESDYITGDMKTAVDSHAFLLKDIDRLNIYNILEPCYHGTSLSAFDIKSLPSTLLQLGKTEKPLAVRKRMFGRAWPVRAPILPGIVPSWSQLLADVSVPCIDDRVATAWLNDPAIRKAIHAKEESEIGRWVLCTGKLSFHHDAGSMISFHRNLTLSGYRALIYSGDHDMCVPFTGSEAWTHSLGYKGAGHTVPEYKPREALDFYSRFLAGSKI
ncbi:hypothetical protein F2Q70_00027136 [Brassica cretica]|uniref:Uncharacterized protein n=1 Tax=Brassica cretica TaxID=69181 RepID=A0A8S9LA59_BRACR|nr:hypothetical protein F2Q70_00027136 [Brassica cretica]